MFPCYREDEERKRKRLRYRCGKSRSSLVGVEQVAKLAIRQFRYKLKVRKEIFVDIVCGVGANTLFIWSVCGVVLGAYRHAPDGGKVC